MRPIALGNVIFLGQNGIGDLPNDLLVKLETSAKNLGNHYRSISPKFQYCIDQVFTIALL